MRLEREVVVSRGGFFARLLDSAVQLLRGRRIHECGRCHGSGIQKVTQLEWAGESDYTQERVLLTTCNRCNGVGAVWR